MENEAAALISEAPIKAQVVIYNKFDSASQKLEITRTENIFTVKTFFEILSDFGALISVFLIYSAFMCYFNNVKFFLEGGCFKI